MFDLSVAFSKYTDTIELQHKMEINSHSHHKSTLKSNSFQFANIKGNKIDSFLQTSQDFAVLTM